MYRKNKLFCNRCQTTKTPQDFTRSSGSWCVSCKAENSKIYYWKNKDNINLEKKKRYNEDSDYREKVLVRNRAYFEENKEEIYRKQAEADRKRKKDPEERKKFQARRKISNSLAAGKIMRKPCDICGSTENLEAHHYMGYEPENWLNVQWLCRKHHGETERFEYVKTNR